MKAVIDSGPLRALFNKRDQHHRLSIDFIQTFRGTLYTTLPVITEVSHMLDFNVKAQLDFLRWISGGAVTLVDLSNTDLEDIIKLSEKYSDILMDFADASLVVIAEKLRLKYVASIDSDFNIYRTLSQGYLENLIKTEVK